MDLKSSQPPGSSSRLQNRGSGTYTFACLLLLLSLFFTSVLPLQAQEDHSDTNIIHYLAAQDRLEIGDTVTAIPLLRLQLRQTPTHRQALKQYFKLWSPGKNDRQIRQELEKRVPLQTMPHLLREILKESPLSPTGRFQLWRSIDEKTLLPAKVFTEMLRLAVDQGDTQFIIDRRPRLDRHYQSDFDPNAFYADWLWKRGDKTQSVKLFRRLVEIRPGHPAGYRGLARHYREIGNDRDARLMQERLEALNN